MEVAGEQCNARIEFRGWYKDEAIFGVYGYGPTGQMQFQACAGQLERLAELLDKFLERPPPPVNVRVELVAPAPARRRKTREVLEHEPRSADELQELEKQQIKRRMLEGK